LVAKTASLDSIQLATFIQGETPPYTYAYSYMEKGPSAGYNYNVPLLASGKMANGGIDTTALYRSVLVNWNPLMPQFVYYGFGGASAIKGKKGIAEAFGMDLQGLIRIAYTGLPAWNGYSSLYDSLSMNLVSESSNTSLLPKADRLKGKNLFSYSLTINRKGATPKDFRKALLNELEQAFGFSSGIEMRQVKIYNLVILDRTKALKLRTNGGQRHYTTFQGKGGFTVSNWKINDLLRVSDLILPVRKMYEYDGAMTPLFFDSTGLDFNIDLSIRADLYDYNDVLKSLRAQGLDLVESQRLMPCIVIKDM
jgi:hypothetical protein